MTPSDSDKKEPTRKTPKPKCGTEEHYDFESKLCVPNNPFTVCPEGLDFDPIVNSCVVVKRECALTKLCLVLITCGLGSEASKSGLCELTKRARAKVICKIGGYTGA